MFFRKKYICHRKVRILFTLPSKGDLRFTLLSPHFSRFSGLYHLQLLVHSPHDLCTR